MLYEEERFGISPQGIAFGEFEIPTEIILGVLVKKQALCDPLSNITAT